jgi:hypothetical protein
MVTTTEIEMPQTRDDKADESGMRRRETADTRDPAPGEPGDGHAAIHG